MQRQADDYQDQPFGELAYAEPQPKPQREPRPSIMEGLVLMAIGILTLLVVFIIIPLVAAPLDQEVSIMIPSSGPGSEWNSSVTPSLHTGASLWATLSGLLKVAGVVVLFTGLLKAISGARG